MNWLALICVTVLGSVLIAILLTIVLKWLNDLVDGDISKAANKIIYKELNDWRNILSTDSENASDL